MKRQRQKRLQNKIYFELLKKAQDKDMVDTKMAQLEKNRKKAEKIRTYELKKNLLADVL